MRYVFLFILILFIGGIGAVLAAPNYVDWNNHKPLIEEKLADAMSVPAVELHGDIDFKLFPAPEIYAAGLTVKPFVGETNIAEIEQFTAKFGWDSIAALRIHAKTINADAINVNIIKLADGKANYLSERRSRRSSQPRSLYPLSGIDNLTVNQLTVTYEDQPNEYTQKLSIPNLQLLAPSFDQATLTAEGTLNETPIALTGTFDLETLRQIEATTTLIVDENTAGFEGSIFDAFSEPMYKGLVTANLVTFDDLFKKLNMPLPAALVRYKDLEGITFRGDIMFNDTTMTVENANLALPQGTIEGRISTKQKGSNGRPMHDVALTTESFDLSSFLEATKGTAAPAANDSSDWSDTPFDLSFLAANDFKISLKANQLKARGHEFDALSIMLNNENKLLMIEEALLGLQQGTARLNGQFKYSNTPNLQTNIRLNRLPMRTFFGSGENIISGALTGSSELTAKGDSVQEMMDNLNGEGELNITEGTLNKIDLKDMVTAMRQIFKKQSSKTDTPFSDMKLTFTIENGTLRNDDFYLHTDKAAIKASGKIDLASKTLNLTVNPQTDAGLTDILIPVKVIGPMDSPNIVPVVTSSVGKGAAIGAMVGGPIGAAAGALIGSKISKDNKKPDAPTEAEAQNNNAQNQAQEVLEQEEEQEALPFDLENATPEEVRKYFEGNQ